MTLLIAVLLSLPIPTPPLGATMGIGRIQPVTQTIAVAGDSGGSGATVTQLPATGRRSKVICSLASVVIDSGNVSRKQFPV